MELRPVLIYIEKTPEGLFLGSISDMPCRAKAKTQTEMLKKIKIEVEKYLDKIKHDRPTENRFVTMEYIDVEYPPEMDPKRMGAREKIKLPSIEEITRMVEREENFY